MKTYDAEMRLMLDTLKLKIARVDFTDDKDSSVYVVALDRPKASQLSVVTEYLPQNAVLNDVEWENNILVLTFEGTSL